ncbi:MAG: response regulator transcription factor [Vicinamibacterales bacterium]
MKPRIVIVEDDSTLRRVLTDSFVFEGFEVESLSCARDVFRCLQSTLPDLILLDVMLPDRSGFDVCRTLQDDFHVPIILVTARGATIDKVRGFASGADDYLTKPFEFEELLARVRAVLRRTQPSQEPLILGDVVIDLNERSATRDGQRIHLNHREFEILRLLSARTGGVVSRSEALMRIWGYSDAAVTRLVDQAITRLRRKIEPDPRRPQFIQSVHGEGYCLRRTKTNDRH